MLNNLFTELSVDGVITKEQLNRLKRNYNSTMLLLNVASSIRKWNNLTDDETTNNIKSTNIQRALMLTGFCSFVKRNDDFYPLPFYPSSVPSLDFRPTEGVCIGYNGETFNVSSLDGTPILKNTPYGWSALPCISDYAERMELIDTTTMGVINAMQVPYVITAPSKDARNDVADAISNALAKRFPVIVADDVAGNAFQRYITVLNTNVNADHISSLTSYRSEVFAQFMRYLGSVDMTGEKRERLLVGEVQLTQQSGLMLENQFNISADENAKLLSEWLGREVTWEKVTNDEIVKSGNLYNEFYKGEGVNNVEE